MNKTLRQRGWSIVARNQLYAALYMQIGALTAHIKRDKNAFNQN